jgi:type IV secretion system protein VirB3
VSGVTPLERDIVFRVLTRPQMFGGVTYSWFVLNLVVTAEIFLIFKTPLALLVAGVLHAVGYVASLKEPRFLELWITRSSRCARVANFGLWGRNSYRP